MKRDNVVQVLVAIFVFLGVYLTYYVDKIWVLLIVVVQIDQFQSVLTGFCILDKTLEKLGFVE